MKYGSGVHCEHLKKQQRHELTHSSRQCAQDSRTKGNESPWVNYTCRYLECVFCVCDVTMLEEKTTGMCFFGCSNFTKNNNEGSETAKFVDESETKFIFLGRYICVVECVLYLLHENRIKCHQDAFWCSHLSDSLTLTYIHAREKKERYQKLLRKVSNTHFRFFSFFLPQAFFQQKKKFLYTNKHFFISLLFLYNCWCCRPYLHKGSEVGNEDVVVHAAYTVHTAIQLQSTLFSAVNGL